ncbi:hypothetical protein KC19_2G064700, partial [Ceratodon purpureus]
LSNAHIPVCIHSLTGYTKPKLCRDNGRQLIENLQTKLTEKLKAIISLVSFTGRPRSESGPVQEHTTVAAAFSAGIHNGREATSAVQDSGIRRSNKTCAQWRVSCPSRATMTPPSPHLPRL